MFADYHVHTEFSDDSVYPMEEVIQDRSDTAAVNLLQMWTIRAI